MSGTSKDSARKSRVRNQNKQFSLKLLYCQLLLAALPPQLDGSSFISVAWLWCQVFSRYDSLMQMAQLEVDAIMGVTIISVGLWRKAEQRGHGRGGHFAVVLWMTVLPAPLASSSHCPASAWSPGTCRSCSPSSSTSWSSCTVLPAVFVFGGLFVPLCICFIRGFDGVSGGSGSWYSRSSSSCRSSASGRSRGACEFRTVLGHLDSSQRSTSTCLAA